MSGLFCGVCLVEIDGHYDFICPPCNHFFHDSCFKAWLKSGNECPVCHRENNKDKN